MENRPAEEDIKLRLANIVSTSQDAMFERFDGLHKQGIHDNDVIGYLRAEGLRDVAAAYIDWSGAIDPEGQEGDDPVVPDPGDSPTNQLIDESHKVSAVTALIAEALNQLREGTFWEPYVNADDPADAVIDGHVDLTAVARHVVKGWESK